MGAPAVKPEFKLDTREFRSTLKEYREVTKRDLATIINTKGFYIARGATRMTHRADPRLIEAALKALVKEGKKNVMVKRFGRYGQVEQAPLVALMINAERGRRGQKGLYGARMAQAVKKFIPRRKRSAAFIASGWIPAIKSFEPFAERKSSAPPRDPAVKQFGRDKGRGVPARPDSFIVKGILENFANAKGDKKNALIRFAGAGLQQAFDAETQSMRDYMQRKLQESADKVSSHEHG